MGVGVGTGVGGEEGVSVGAGTLGVLVGIGVSGIAGAGVKVGLGVLVGIGSGVGALAINEVSGQPRHPNALPKTKTAIRITNRDLLIIYGIFILLSRSLANAAYLRACIWSFHCFDLKSHIADAELQKVSDYPSQTHSRIRKTRSTDFVPSD